MPDLKHSEGHQYLKKTRFDRRTLDERVRLRIEPGEAFKTYPAAERIALPAPPLTNFPADLWQLLQQRRSTRKYSGTSITPEDLSLLLWASQGDNRPGRQLAVPHRPFGRRPLPHRNLCSGGKGGGSRCRPLPFQRPRFRPRTVA